MRVLGLLIIAVAAFGCGTEVDWSPKYAKQPEYPQVVEVASRVRHSLPDCSRIGVVHSDGEVDDVVPALAREAAEHGGTHYTIEGDDEESDVVTKGTATTVGNLTFMHARSHTETTRYIWAIVYRCRDDVHAPADDSE